MSFRVIPAFLESELAQQVSRKSTTGLTNQKVPHLRDFLLGSCLLKTETNSLLIGDMREANIIIFEDSDATTEGIRLNFSKNNTGPEYSFKIIEAVSTIDSARKLIEDLEEGEVDFAIVDGNLSPGSTDSQEGAEIVRLLHENFTDIVTIGFSASPREFGASVMIHKQDGFKPLVDEVKNS